MTDNPYAAPQQSSSGPTRSLDFGAAFSAGTAAFSNNWLTWTGVSVVSMLLMTISILLCGLPFLVVGPAIFWGMNRFAIEAQDGTPSFDRTMSGFEDLGRSVPPMLLLALVILLVNMPVQIVSFGISYVADQDPMSQLAVSAFTTGLSVVYQAVFWTRFSLSGFLIADRGLPATEAMSTSWEMTSGSWFSLAILNLLAGILASIGVIGCIVGMFVTMGWGASIQAAAYRQLAGRSVTA